jgi:hypothetical protein
VVPDASSRHDLTAVHEVEIDVHYGGGNEQHASHVPGTFMGAAVLVFVGVGVTNPGLELGLGEGGGSQKNGESKQGQRLIAASHRVPVSFFVKFATPMFATAGIICSSSVSSSKKCNKHVKNEI